MGQCRSVLRGSIEVSDGVMSIAATPKEGLLQSQDTEHESVEASPTAL
jgi:hypothetical protein